MPHGGDVLLVALLVVLVAPVCEELFFRGLVFKGLRRRYGFGISAALSGLVFGLAHLEQAIPGPWQNAFLLVGVLALVGVGLALIYERRGTIAANMAAHSAFNVIGFLIIVKVIQ
jgi:membrane protease YdiL (CAAX protease family)